MKKVFEAIIVMLLSPFIVLLFGIVLFAIPGILLGYDYYGPACVNYRNGKRTRIERIVFPLTPYACKKDAGILEPYVSDFFDYMTEVPKEGEW